MVNNIRKIWMVVVFNFRRWRYDRKIWLAFILNFIMCYFLTEKILQFSEKENTIMQIFEPFIWGFDDLEAIFFMKLLLLLYFADIPYLGNEVPFYLCRMTRKIWLAGQVVYIVCATAIYTVAILLSTILICGQRCYVGNIWSETAVKLAFTSAGKKLSLAASEKTLELTRPYACMTTIFFLLFAYALVMVLLIFWFRILWNELAGMIAGVVFNGISFIFSPGILQKLLGISERKSYLANVAAGWISPLSHATYHLHNFGYDRLPSLRDSGIYDMVLVIMLIVLNLYSIRTYHFVFDGTGER